MKNLPKARAQTILQAVLLSFLSLVCAAEVPQKIVVDAAAPARPFPHFWEKAFGSGRAVLALREDYRNDLREVKKATDFQFLRFHAIFHDDLGVYEEDPQGNPLYNFSYVDQVYDGLLANGVRPLVEISFMPRKLAAKETDHPFWDKPSVSPPKDYGKWDDLIRKFAGHLVQRYGIDEVAQWYFEVWNEPNIDFWAGEPKQLTYFELYDHTARALRSVSPRLRVGGPATAAADWVDDFIAYCSKRRVPLDFISTHGYADDTVENLFHTHEDVPMDQRVCRAVRKVHEQIVASPLPSLPLMWTEWNVPSFGELKARDSTYVGAALADDIRQCDGLVDMLSYWTFDDVFDESGPVREPFYGGFGLIASGGIKKPSYNAFALLHKLGSERFPSSSANVLITKRDDGTLVIALWDLVDPDREGHASVMELEFHGIAVTRSILVHRLDERHGNTVSAYQRMGMPRYPTPAQIKKLDLASELPAPEKRHLQNGRLSVDVPPNGLVILEIPK